MKEWKYHLMMILALTLSLSIYAACGDDDDDDDNENPSDDDNDDDNQESCAEACDTQYNVCGNYFEDEDGNPYTEEECAQYCEYGGGLDDCMIGCFDAFDQDNDCTSLWDCMNVCLP